MFTLTGALRTINAPTLSSGPWNIAHSNFLTLIRKMSGFRQGSTPSDRNKGPILEVLERHLNKAKPNLRLLEISAGYGVHAAFFAPQFPNIQYQPSEYDRSALRHIDAYRTEVNVPNLQPPIVIDISQPCSEWVNDAGINLASCSGQFDYMLNINMMHISPFNCSEGLFRNAGQLLKVGGLLVTYGPYANDGVLVPESNVRFDASLKRSNPEWGVRDITVLKALANEQGIRLKEANDLPANNKCLVWEKMKK